MRALSVWQPWATTIILGGKPYEFRRWPAPAGIAARTKPCPCTGCAVQCGRGHLMCRDHWMSVPGALRRQVNRAWRDYRALLRAIPRDKTELLMQARAYQSAADAAIQAAGG